MVLEDVVCGVVKEVEYWPGELKGPENETWKGGLVRKLVKSVDVMVKVEGQGNGVLCRP